MSTCRWSTLARCLGGELLAGRLAAGRLARRLLGTCHVVVGLELQAVVQMSAQSGMSCAHVCIVMDHSGTCAVRHTRDRPVAWKMQRACWASLGLTNGQARRMFWLPRCRHEVLLPLCACAVNQRHNSSVLSVVAVIISTTLITQASSACDRRFGQLAASRRRRLTFCQLLSVLAPQRKLKQSTRLKCRATSRGVVRLQEVLLHQVCSHIYIQSFAAPVLSAR